MRKILLISIFILMIFVSGCIINTKLEDSSIDTSKCEKLNDTEMILCYSNLSMSQQDPSICDEIKDRESREFCYGIVIIDLIKFENANVSICKKIKDEYYVDACYFLFATRRINKFFCNEINNQSIKNMCYKEVANVN